MLVFFQGKVKYESHKSKVWVIQSRTTFSHFLSFWIWSRLCAMLYCVSVIVTQENSELSCKYPCSLHQLSWTKKKKKSSRNPYHLEFLHNSCLIQLGQSVLIYCFDFSLWADISLCTLEWILEISLTFMACHLYSANLLEYDVA